MKITFRQFWFVIAIMTIALNALLITGCNGEETSEGSSPTSGPPTEAKKYDALNLYSTSWDTDSSGQSYGSADQIKLSHFSTVKPKQGDVLKFKISGTSSKELKNFQITLFQMQGTNWDTYKWLGASSCVLLPSSFNDYTTEEVTLYNSPNSNDIYVSLNDVLWQKDSDGNYTVGDDGSERFPSTTKNGDIIATITDFSISLVKDSGNGTPGGGGSGGDGWLGNTLTITNAQVYEYDDVKDTFSPSNKTVTGLSYVVHDYSIKSLTEIINGSSSVTLKNGKLNISMGTPKASALTTFDNIVGSSGINSSAKIFRFLSIYNNLNFDDDTIGILQISESGLIEYWYCDRDVNISAKFIYEDDRATSYALNLKTGWNSVIPSYKLESEGNYIETIITGKPSSNSRWIMDHIHMSSGGGGGIPPVVVGGGGSDNQP